VLLAKQNRCRTQNRVDLYVRASEVHNQVFRNFVWLVVCLGFILVFFLVQSKDSKELIYFENNGVSIKHLKA